MWIVWDVHFKIRREINSPDVSVGIWSYLSFQRDRWTEKIFILTQIDVIFTEIYYLDFSHWRVEKKCETTVKKYAHKLICVWKILKREFYLFIHFRDECAFTIMYLRNDFLFFCIFVI